jgi:hypothetical protein
MHAAWAWRIGMSFDPLDLFLSIIISSFGLVLFVYGKKQTRAPHMVIGLAYMIYPYFVPSTAWLVGIAVALVLVLWLTVRRGR